MSDFVDALTFIGDHVGLLGRLALTQLWVSAAAMAIALAIALPLGVWLGHLHRFAFLAINGGNMLRALPSFAVVAVALTVLPIGPLTTMIALVVVAFPVILTNAYTAVDGVDRDAVEAAQGMGMNTWEVLTRVELPLAIPLMFGGIRTAAVFVVATAPLGAVAGSGGGLGDVILNQASYRFSGVLAAAMCVAALALLTEVAFALLQRAVTPRGLRLERATGTSVFGPARQVPTAAAVSEA